MTTIFVKHFENHNFYCINKQHLPPALTIFEMRFNCSVVEHMNVLPENSDLRLWFKSNDTELGFKIVSTNSGW